MALQPEEQERVLLLLVTSGFLAFWVGPKARNGRPPIYEWLGSALLSKGFGQEKLALCAGGEDGRPLASLRLVSGPCVHWVA